MSRVAVVVGVAIAVGYAVLTALGHRSHAMNARVVAELRADPQGERARRVMLLTLPSGKAIPVNYLREDRTVYAAADFPWWRELGTKGGRGQVLIRGETLAGHVRALPGDSALRRDVFARLRPTAPLFFGTLVVVELD